MIPSAYIESQRSVVQAKTIGLNVPPICPAVFMAALTKPAFRPDTSTHAPQLAPNRKFELAAPSAIRHAPRMEWPNTVAAAIDNEATASDAPATPQRPIRNP